MSALTAAVEAAGRVVATEWPDPVAMRRVADEALAEHGVCVDRLEVTDCGATLQLRRLPGRALSVTIELGDER